MIRIAEIFHSIQGEGALTGVPSVFIRTSGCNLRCWFCDTPYASWTPEGDAMTVEQIVAEAVQFKCEHIVLTGGEPMISTELPNLCQQLKSNDKHITIETAGTVIHNPVAPCDLMSISPKLSNSTPAVEHAGSWNAKHESTRHRPEIVRALMESSPQYQLKFVVGSLLDAEEVLEYLDDLGTYERKNVLIMPRGTESSELLEQSRWLVPWCNKHSLRYCDRAHIHWFGNRRGT